MRAALNELREITSTLHLKMKFPTESGIGEVTGDKWVPRQSYNITLKDFPDKASLGIRCKEEEK